MHLSDKFKQNIMFTKTTDVNTYILMVTLQEANYKIPNKAGLSLIPKSTQKYEMLKRVVQTALTQSFCKPNTFWQLG